MTLPEPFQHIMRAEVPKRPDGLPAFASGGSVVYDDGPHRWRVSHSRILLAYFEYWPDHATRVGLPWKRVYFRPGYLR